MHSSVRLLQETDARTHPRKHLLEQLKIFLEIIGRRIHALDYTESSHESWAQNLMNPVTPEVTLPSIRLISFRVRAIASSVTSGGVLNRSDTKRLNQRQKPLR